MKPDFKSWKLFSKGFKSIDEADLFWDICMEIKPKQILEIGRRCGISTCLLGLIASITGGHVWSIDGAPRKEAETILIDSNIMKHVTFINEWAPWIPFDFNWHLDLLYIDGDHKYISVLVDYHTFNYFLKQGGYVAFHDAIHKPVAEAIIRAVGRDRLEFVDSINSLSVYRKTDKERRVYFDFPNTEFDVK